MAGYVGSVEIRPIKYVHRPIEEFDVRLDQGQMLTVTHLHQIDDVISETYAEDDHVKAFVIDGLGREAHTFFRGALHNPVNGDVGVVVKASAVRCSED